ncbi:MAG: hypothetical protein NZ959_12095 [Armatimonadetes bacterium]|nr:hypothetical protein [Armatimonadota bacterium]MDW8123037.1 hypothetical protein [Armatimonadota bacterium]
MKAVLRAFIYDFDLRTATEQFQRLRNDWGMDGISLVAVSPARVVLLPNAPGDRLRWIGEGTLCFQPHPAWYADLRFLPVFDEQAAKEEVFRRLVEAAKEAGLSVMAVVPCCQNSAIGRRYHDLTVLNALDDRIQDFLCPANPDARTLMAALVGDLCSNYAIDGVELESLGYLLLSRVQGLVSDIELTPAIEFLMSRCFCAHCTRAATERDIEIERVRFFAKTQLEQFFIAPTDFANTPLEWDIWASLVEGVGEQILYLRMAIVSSLLALLVEAAQKKDKKVHIEGHLLPARLWTVGLDRQQMVLLADAIEVDAKEVPPDRLPPSLILNKQVVSTNAELWVRLHPSERFVANRHAFLAQAKACKDHNVSGVVFAGYGSLRRQNWSWIQEAVSLLKS